MFWMNLFKFLFKTNNSIDGETLIWPWTDEIFWQQRYLTPSVWLKRKMKNPPINRIGRDTGKVPLIGCLTTDSDWWVIIGGITRHWQRYPWVNSSSDETPAELWVDTVRTFNGMNWNRAILFKFESLFKCIHGKWQRPSCWNEHTYASPADTHSVQHMCTKAHRRRHTAAACPCGSFHFCGKGQLNIPELNCCLHSHLSTETSPKTQQ